MVRYICLHWSDTSVHPGFEPWRCLRAGAEAIVVRNTWMGGDGMTVVSKRALQEMLGVLGFSRFLRLILMILGAAPH